nr:NBS-LRR disease resistance protein [Dasypyrum villosum]
MAAILETLLKSSVNKLQDVIMDEAILILGVEKELKKLLRRVKLIQCCIYDAEKRRTKEQAVNNWLGQLRDVIYDVDEILDVAGCKGSKLLADHPSPSSGKSVACKGLSVSSCFCNIVPRRDVAVRIRSLNKKIENISKDKIFLTFNTSIQPTRNGPISKLVRSSNLIEPNLVGKEIIHSSRKLVELVLAHKENKSYKFAIVGTGGVGKTTLAQKIYNDQKVKGSFKLHAWICVSQDYNQITLLKEVLRNIGVHHEQGETITELQRKLAETIEGKSFFLVLDDVWHSNVWTDLLRPALHEATAGVVLVTTRDDQITRRIGVEHTHRVDLMSVEVGWELLWKSMNIDEEKEVHNLRNTGIEIVHKCGRLPLAIKVTASALASGDLTENEWKKYLDKHVGSQSMLSDEIEVSLYLSYDELPHRLKQCFLYYALYVEDSIIEREEVTWLWIAEGFIEEQQGQLLEDIAEEYYYELIHRNLHELIYRNLLQPDTSYFDMSYCKMHDLLRQLALNISREECFIGDVETLRGENMSKLRRVTAVTKKDMLVLSRMDKLDVKVRTFLTVNSPRRIEDTLFKRFLLLRVLVLNYTLVQSIPDYIGKLIHLRLLNLDYTGISCLPESIGSLNNLQVLSLRCCVNLHTLPSAMTLLSSLRCLDFFGTKINQVPKGMGKLKLLSYLGDYPVGDGSVDAVIQDGWKLEELSSLSQMRLLMDQKHLKQLALAWTERGEGSYSEEDVRNAEKVFEQLIPPHNLEDLCILRFFGRQYPTWFGTTCLSSLIYLIINDILSYSKEDVQSTRLKLLPRLVRLGLTGCPKLRALPRQLGKEATSFKELRLIGTNSLKAVENLPLLSELLDIQKCEGLQRISNLPQMTELHVHGCPNLSHVEGLVSLQQLGLGEDMQEISSRWVPGLQNQHQRLHGEDLDIYTLSTS